MQYHTLTPGEAKAKSPLLPLDQIPINRERNTLWLVHNQRLQIGSVGLFLKLMMILLRLVGLEHRIMIQLWSRASRETNDLNYVFGNDIQNRRERKRCIIMIRSWMFGSSKQIALRLLANFNSVKNENSPGRSVASVSPNLVRTAKDHTQPQGGQEAETS